MKHIYQDQSTLQKLLSCHKNGIHCTHLINVAMLYRSLDIVTILLDHGADPLVYEENHNNILHLYAQDTEIHPEDEDEIVGILLN